MIQTSDAVQSVQAGDVFPVRKVTIFASVTVRAVPEAFSFQPVRACVCDHILTVC